MNHQRRLRSPFARRRRDWPLLLACLPVLTTADPLAGTAIFGSNTLRFESYSDSGDELGSPYPYTGTFFHDEFGASFNTTLTPYDRWRGQVFGVVNDSPYRAREMGLLPERMSLVREKGDSAIPFRAEVGDYFAYFSYLTQQRSLKGGSIELQPWIGGYASSLVVMTGELEPTWTELDFGNDHASGASWLVESTPLGTVNLNYVYNQRDGDLGKGLLERRQHVFSGALEKMWQFGFNRVTFEGEYAQMEGDHDGRLSPFEGQGQSGDGVFLEMRGDHAHLPFDWRVRSERYDNDFRPHLGVIQPNRQSTEGHAGWRFGSGLSLRGRLQAFDDSFDAGDEQQTRTAGVTLSGPLLYAWMPDLSGNVDLYGQSIETHSSSFDAELTTLTADLTKPLVPGWIGRLGVFWQNQSDASLNDADLNIRQVNLAVDRAFALGGWSGIVTPGVLLRAVDGSGRESDEWQPTLALRAMRDRHSIGVNYGYLVQDRRTAFSTNVRTQTFAFDYRYSLTRDVFGVEAQVFDRGVQRGRDTEAWRVGVFWTHSFERSPSMGAAAGTASASRPVANGAPGDLVSLAPGTGLAAAQAALAGAGITGGAELGGLYVYEYQYLREIPQRQRLALVHSGGALDLVAVVIEVDEAGGGANPQQVFERVQKALIDRYGTPATAFEEGDFAGGLGAGVATGQVIRLYEWPTAGGVLRLGIPRRLDGRVRIEIQHRASFPQPRDTLWSVEALR